MADYKIRSGDDEEFYVNSSIAHLSILFETMFDVSKRRAVREVIFAVPKIESEIMHLVIGWLKKHKDEPDAGKAPMALTRWDKDYFKRELHTIEKLFIASKELRLEGLESQLEQFVVELEKMAAKRTVPKDNSLNELTDSNEPFHEFIMNRENPSDAFLKVNGDSKKSYEDESKEMEDDTGTTDEDSSN